MSCLIFNLKEGKNMPLSQTYLQPGFFKQSTRNHNWLNQQDINRLINSITDPCTASIAILINAEAGDLAGYKQALDQLFYHLNNLNQNPDAYPTWQRNSSFQLWMAGRAFSAAMTMQDIETIRKTKIKLLELKEKLNKTTTEEKITSQENLAFTTWGTIYFCIFDAKEYKAFSDEITSNTDRLVEIYIKSKTHQTLSDALWGLILNLLAAASNNDPKKYELIKKKITDLTSTVSVDQALQENLLVTKESNDFPAWGCGLVCLAAALNKDYPLYKKMHETIDEIYKNASREDYWLGAFNMQKAEQVGKQNWPQEKKPEQEAKPEQEQILRCKL